MKTITNMDNYTRSYDVNIYDELDIVGMELLTSFMKDSLKLNPLLDLPCYKATKFEFADNKVKYMLFNVNSHIPYIYMQLDPLDNDDVEYFLEAVCDD